MKIKLSEEQWKQVIDSLNAIDDCEMTLNSKDGVVRDALDTSKIVPPPQRIATQEIDKIRTKSIALQNPNTFEITRKGTNITITFLQKNAIDVWNVVDIVYTVTIPEGATWTIGDKFSLIINPNRELELIANYMIYQTYKQDECITICQNINGTPMGLIGNLQAERRSALSQSSIVWNKTKVSITEYGSGSGIHFKIKEGVNLSARTLDNWRNILYNTQIEGNCWNNHFLYWNLNTNSIIEHDSIISQISFILLARVDNGKVTDGLFKDIFVSEDLLQIGYNYNRTVITNSSKYYSYPLKVALKKDDIIKVRLRSSIVAPVLAISLLDADKNNIVTDFVRIANNTDTGDCMYKLPIDAEYINYYLGNVAVGTELTFDFKLVKSNETTAFLKYSDINLPTKQITWSAASQDLTVVGNEIWHFHAANDDHQTLAPYIIFDGKTRQWKAEKKHNIGHVNSCDYNAVTDTFLACNGNEKHIGFDLFFLQNASNHAGNIDIANMMKITFTDREKILDQYGGMACFGESESIIYLVSRDSKKIYKVLLGMGASDFSDNTGADLTKWGVFIDGKSDKEYNGTAKILATYSSQKDIGLMQGICYHSGAIYLLVGYGHGRDNLHKIKCYSDNTFDVIDSFDFHFYGEGDNQDELVIEPEGLSVYNGCYFLFGGIVIKDSGGGTRLYISPLPEQNSQCGFGKTSERVLYDFPNCDKFPRISIMPTNPISTPIYVESSDQFGFTARTSDNSAIEFYYECRIS